MPLTVLVTRDVEDAPKTAERLRRAGFGAVVASLIERRADDAALVSAIAVTPAPDLLLLTSAFAAKQLGRVGARTLQAGRVACVGPATADAAKMAGLRVDLVPKEATGAALVAELGDLTGRVVLYPRAADALPSTREALERAGAVVRDVVTYGTVASSQGAAALAAAGAVDVVLLASPSTVRAYVAARAAVPGHGTPPVAPIGSTTAEACRVAGLPIAESGTVDAIRAALRS